jgi:hypothetical protein
MKKQIVLLSLLLWVLPAAADAPAGQFEIIDVSGQIVGDPLLTSDAARTNWTKSCQDWKTETKDLNKNNEILGLNCNSPSCSLIDSTKWQCTSTGTYKVKTAGVRVNTQTVAPAVPEAPMAAPLPPEHEIAMAPPAPVIEIVPSARVGYIWIGGYWGWAGHRHVWVPGRWVNERPGYIWIPERWDRHGRGWHFESGRWDVRH